MNYTLTVTVTKSKSGKYHYQVLDESGTVISERRSNRKYVACTIIGSHYFGRLDLIGKGDHGRYIKMWMEISSQPVYSGDGRYNYTPAEASKRLEALNSIAYLSPSMSEPAPDVTWGDVLNVLPK